MMTDFDRCTICGKLVVGEEITVPKNEFLALKEMAEAYVKSQKSFKKYQSYSRSPIAKNHELAGFILECQNTMTLYEIQDACREKFNGIGPSKSSIYRFLKALKTPFERPSKPI
jgi:hypothetical protein